MKLESRITDPQRMALRMLRDTVSGCAYAGNMRGVRLATLRVLHRSGLIKADGEPIASGTVVTITEHGRAAIAHGGG